MSADSFKVVYNLKSILCSTLSGLCYSYTFDSNSIIRGDWQGIYVVSNVELENVVLAGF